MSLLESQYQISNVNADLCVLSILLLENNIIVGKNKDICQIKRAN